ncbi:MAG: hypothetical protein V3S11_03035 [Elusimicrobiota bacterium]
MNTPIDIPAREIFPDRDSFLKHHCPPKREGSRQRLEKSAEHALSLLNNKGKLRALLSPVSGEDFKTIFPGEGRNDNPAPLPKVFPKARRLGLFVVTLGEGVSQEIERLHKKGDFPTAHLLDDAASRAVQDAVSFLEEGTPRESGEASLSYSPGYCGWHVSGQRKLLARLGAETIGVTLSEGFMMSPVKSASGVILTGAPEIHDFTNAYSFCGACENKNCRDRIDRVHHAAEAGAPKARHGNIQ